MESPDRPEMAPADEAPPGEPSSGPNTCPECAGAGRRDDGGDCPACGGTGEVNEAVGGG